MYPHELGVIDVCYGRCYYYIGLYITSITAIIILVLLLLNLKIEVQQFTLIQMVSTRIVFIYQHVIEF